MTVPRCNKQSSAVQRGVQHVEIKIAPNSAACHAGSLLPACSSHHDIDAAHMPRSLWTSAHAGLTRSRPRRSSSAARISAAAPLNCCFASRNRMRCSCGHWELARHGRVWGRLGRLATCGGKAYQETMQLCSCLRRHSCPTWRRQKQSGRRDAWKEMPRQRWARPARALRLLGCAHPALCHERHRT